ncbi:MAG: zinc-ribbon domain-containing protein [Streptosporangiaceae bacterium]
MASPWMPSSDYWKSIDAKSGTAKPPDNKGSSDEEKADNHIADAKKSTMMGLHSLAAAHMARASALTHDSGKQDKINDTAKNMAKIAMAAGKGSAWNLSNVTLADGPVPYRKMPDETVKCQNCGKYNDVDARYCDQCGAKLTPAAYVDASNTYRLAMPASEIAKGRKGALKQGLALPPASPGGQPGFPIKDAAHWDKALQAVGRTGGGARRAALAKLLRKTAPMFGRTAQLKNSWAAPAGAAMSNGAVMSVQGYDLAARYRALQAKGVITLADDSGTHNNGMESATEDNSTMDGVECGNCQTLNNFAAKYCSQCGTPMPESNDTSDANGTTLDKQPSVLQTPASGNLAGKSGFSPGSAGINVRGASSGSMGSMSNIGRQAIQLSRRMAVTGASDIVVSRGPGGVAVIRHRRGGGTIGQIEHLDDGTWGGKVEGGPQLLPHTHQRAALQELLGTWNKSTTTEYRRGEPLMPPPAQTPLMAQYGVPAIRALATSDDDSDDSSSSRSGDSGSGPAGLTPKGLTIYKKLIAKGFPPARALVFARNSQNMSGGTFKKAS